MRFYSRLIPTALLLVVLSSTGCLFRSHRVESRLSTAPLKTATQQELVDLVNAQAATIRTMTATVDIATSVGGQKKGKVTEYEEIRGYIIAEKPAMLRMIGLLPVVRNRAFDMVSNGREFRLWIPPKNRFIMGANEVVKPSPNALENLRPQVIYDALLLREIDPQREIAVIESGFQQVVDDHKRHLEQPDYVLDIIRRDVHGNWLLSRKIYFDRSNLQAYRQEIFDEKGSVSTDAMYSVPQQFNGISFPTRIEIVRPQEEYTVGLHILKLTLNGQLQPDQFDLPQPPGVQVTVLDGAGSSSASAARQ